VRRLSRVLGARLARARGERGAIAVALALFMPLVFGAAAITIDTTAVWSARQQVATGADAAVIAVAMDCARGNCGDIKATAEAAFWANDEAGKAADLGPGEGWISVNGHNVSATQKTPWLVKHYFAAALGYSTGSLSVQSYAQWAPAVKARTMVPLVISLCDWATKRGSLNSSTPTTIGLTTAPGAACSYNGATVPGGSALTAIDSGSTCRTTSTYNTAVSGLTGELPVGCTGSYLAGLVGRDVQIPVWDSTGTSSYHVFGYSAFHVTGYDPSTASPALSGYFTLSARQVNDTTPPATTAPDLGARSVFLTHS
jgi:uncharacterized membrane protein